MWLLLTLVFWLVHRRWPWMPLPRLLTTWLLLWLFILYDLLQVFVLSVLLPVLVHHVYLFLEVEQFFLKFEVLLCKHLGSAVSAHITIGWETDWEAWRSIVAYYWFVTCDPLRPAIVIVVTIESAILYCILLEFWECKLFSRGTAVKVLCTFII